MKQSFLTNIKNVYGWKTNKKIVVISVDDYGNVALDSRLARDKMNKAGLKVKSRFDIFDSLETKEDLEVLYDALTCVKDRNNHHAVFTPFAIPCNIDYEKMADENYEQYHYELLPSTYEKLSIINPESYKGSWDLWQEGMTKGLLVPQFHGREHFNLKVFEEKLAKKDFELLTSLKNRSNVSISNSGYETIKYSAAFDFWEFKENESFINIINDGLDKFHKVFGYQSVHFNPPGGKEHAIIHKTLKNKGIKYIDVPLIKNEHQGKGKYKKVINFTGKINKHGMIYQVRNVVFEPTDNRGFNWVDYSFKQIETAFFWKRPAIISSHRVNFCGHIDPQNRKIGIDALKELLQRIVKKWPEVEFMSADKLGDLISSKHHK